MDIVPVSRGDRPTTRCSAAAIDSTRPANRGCGRHIVVLVLTAGAYGPICPHFHHYRPALYRRSRILFLIYGSRAGRIEAARSNHIVPSSQAKATVYGLEASTPPRAKRPATATPPEHVRSTNTRCTTVAAAEPGKILYYSWHLYRTKPPTTVAPAPQYHVQRSFVEQPYIISTSSISVALK